MILVLYIRHESVVCDPICNYAPVGCDAPADWNVIVTGSNHTIVIPAGVVPH